MERCSERDERVACGEGAQPQRPPADTELEVKVMRVFDVVVAKDPGASYTYLTLNSLQIRSEATTSSIKKETE